MYYSTDNEQLGKRQYQYSFLQFPEVSESDSEEAMLKRPRFTSSANTTQPFRIDSDESSIESEQNITNAQSCKFGRVKLEMSEGETRNFSTSSAQAQSTTASVQPPIMKHFVRQPKSDAGVNNTNAAEDNSQASGSAPQPQGAGPSIGGTYSLVRSGIALSNL